MAEHADYIDACIKIVLMDVSIIIVNYNTCILTRNCLKSVFEQTKDIDFEVIVSDNGSKDGSVEMVKTEFPQVILIENDANLGFGAANNRGLKIANGKYIFYLNSDTILLNNAVKIFFDYWENSTEKDKIGALGGNLLNEKGNIIHSYGRFPRAWKEIVMFLRKYSITRIKFLLNILNINYKKNIKKDEVAFKKSKYIGDVEYITGADLFLENKESSFFDERYFLYYEETNLEWYLKERGLRRIIIDGPRIIHLAGKSDSTASDGRLEDYVSFGQIQCDLSRIRFVKYNLSLFCAFILKILLCFFWMLPAFYKKTKKYRKEIWKI